MNTMENNKNGVKCESSKAKHAATAHLKKRPSALLSFTPIALLVIMLVASRFGVLRAHRHGISERAVGKF